MNCEHSKYWKSSLNNVCRLSCGKKQRIAHFPVILKFFFLMGFPMLTNKEVFCSVCSSEWLGWIPNAWDSSAIRPDTTIDPPSPSKWSTSIWRVSGARHEQSHTPCCVSGLATSLWTHHQAATQTLPRSRSNIVSCREISFFFALNYPTFLLISRKKAHVHYNRNCSS